MCERERAREKNNKCMILRDRLRETEMDKSEREKEREREREGGREGIAYSTAIEM